MTKIESYLAEQKWSVADLCERLNALPEMARARPYSVAGLRKVVVGDRKPSHETMRLICIATKGEIQPNDWFDLDQIMGLAA